MKTLAARAGAAGALLALGCSPGPEPPGAQPVDPEQRGTVLAEERAEPSSYAPGALQIDGSDLSREPPTPLAPAGAAGRIAWQEGADQYGFGEVLQGESCDHTFELWNSGEGELVIDGLRSSCGCTRSEIFVRGNDGERSFYPYGTPLPAGASFELETTLDTQRRQGEFKATVAFLSNDARGLVSLQLTASIQPVLTVEPAHVDFGQVRYDEVVEREVLVGTNRDQPFSLEFLEGSLPPHLSVELTPSEPDETGRALAWQVRLTLGSDMPEGVRSYAVRLVSDLELSGEEPAPQLAELGLVQRFHQIDLLARSHVLGVFSPVPSWIRLDPVRPGQAASGSVRVTCNDPEFELRQPETALVGYPTPGNPGGSLPYPESYEVRVTPLPELRAWDVELALLGLDAAAQGPLRGRIQLDFGHPAADPLEIPFTGYCIPADSPGGQR